MHFFFFKLTSKSIGLTDGKKEKNCALCKCHVFHEFLVLLEWEKLCLGLQNFPDWWCPRNIKKILLPDRKMSTYFMNSRFFSIDSIDLSRVNVFVFLKKILHIFLSRTDHNIHPNIDILPCDYETVLGIFWQSYRCLMSHRHAPQRNSHRCLYKQRDICQLTVSQLNFHSKFKICYPNTNYQHSKNVQLLAIRQWYFVCFVHFSNNVRWASCVR